MAKLQIPNEHKLGLEKIRTMAVTEFDTLLSKLSLRTGQAKMNDLEDDVASASDMTSEDAKRIISALISMHVTIANSEISLEEFAENIISSLENPNLPESERSESANERFKSRIVTLLNLEAFRIASKAIDLQAEYERAFCRVRILTDLRPVFGTNISEGPKGVVLVHLLHLTYHPAENRGAHKEIQIALDPSDLKKLKKAIARAEEKQKVLEETLKSAGIPRLAE